MGGDHHARRSPCLAWLIVARHPYHVLHEHAATSGKLKRRDPIAFTDEHWLVEIATCGQPLPGLPTSSDGAPTSSTQWPPLTLKGLAWLAPSLNSQRRLVAKERVAVRDAFDS